MKANASPRVTSDSSSNPLSQTKTPSDPSSFVATATRSPFLTLENSLMTSLRLAGSQTRWESILGRSGIRHAPDRVDRTQFPQRDLPRKPPDASDSPDSGRDERAPGVHGVLRTAEDVSERPRPAGRDRRGGGLSARSRRWVETPRGFRDEDPDRVWRAGFQPGRVWPDHGA